METLDELVERLTKYNAAYRAGTPLVDDATYDALVERLRGLSPEHPFLHRVEPEVFPGRREVAHPEPMLSTEKAYNQGQLARFVDRVTRAAEDLSIEALDIRFRVTPKLDGLAGRDDGRVFATRGNGLVGYEVSSAFSKGVIPVGGRGRGLGEIVIVESYFDHHLAGEFVHPRNMVVGIVSSDTLNPHAKKALDAGVVRFVPYEELPGWEGDGRRLVKEIDTIKADLLENIDYPTDGLVVDVVDAAIRSHMGATSHHYRWQIALKTRGETAVTTVEDVEWQVGRTGKITPVLRVEPVALSGATIRRVTAHHAGLVEKLSIGKGARIEIIRSGEVIPKLEKVLAASKEVSVPDRCPSCGTALAWQNDFLVCPNPHCRAQTEQAISHFFKTLGNADWFGIKTIERLVAGGFDSLEKIYAITEKALTDLGFGPVQAKNLLSAIEGSRTRPVEDWRFLAALGISNLGKGVSGRLLGHCRLEDLEGLTREAIEKIHGFGAITAAAIVADIQKVAPTLRHLLTLGFTLERTPLLTESRDVQSPISEKAVVFSGRMTESRSAMEAGARALGAVVQSAVSGKTDLLVCGEAVGEKKLQTARRLGVRVITESAYREMIGSAGKEHPV